jgi:hypothetical protein
VGRLNEVHDVVDRENFDIIIWNFNVENKRPKIARVAKDCSIIRRRGPITMEGKARRT